MRRSKVQEELIIKVHTLNYKLKLRRKLKVHLQGDLRFLKDHRIMLGMQKWCQIVLGGKQLQRLSRAVK